jgi:hypothetical protein
MRRGRTTLRWQGASVDSVPKCHGLYMDRHAKLRVGWRSQGCVGLGHASVPRIIDLAIPSLDAVARVLCLTGASCRVGSVSYYNSRAV